MAAMHRALKAAVPDVPLLWLDNGQRFDPSALDDAVVLGNLNVDHVDYCMPLRGRAHYIVHDHAPGRQDASRYDPLLAAGRVVFYDVFRGRPGRAYTPISEQPLCFSHREHHRAVITWATDLLPDEIDEAWTRARARPVAPTRNVVFVGSVWRANAEEIADLAHQSVARDLEFEHFGRVMVPTRWPESERVHVYGRSIPFDDNVRRVAAAHVAPALQGRHQLRNAATVGNYVPCRIFKNISYGAFGVSNNPTVADVLGSTVAVDEDIGGMLDAAMERVRVGAANNGLGDAMALVARAHTYFSRLALLLELAVARHEHVGAADPAVNDEGRLAVGLRRTIRRAVGWGWQ